jgi:hypothetical protein
VIGLVSLSVSSNADPKTKIRGTEMVSIKKQWNTRGLTIKEIKTREELKTEPPLGKILKYELDAQY